MPKRKAAIKKPCANDSIDEEEREFDKKIEKFIHNEVERRSAASKAIRDAETQHLLTGLRLLRTNCNKEQLQIPVLNFFEENMPNLIVKVDEEGGFEMELKDRDDNLSGSHADETNRHHSLLREMSKAYPDNAAAAAGMPLTGGFEFPSKAVNMADPLSNAGFQYPDFVMEEPSTSQDPGLLNAFHTPGANSQRLSVGMTPKTLRLPKPGEMLLSVRGSPLGTYKDDNMEAIHESEEGSVD